MDKARSKRVTERRKQRAIDALVDLIECKDFDRHALEVLDRAADTIRAMKSGG